MQTGKEKKREIIVKRKKETKFRWGLCVITCLFVLFHDGCGDSQSPSSVYIGDFEVALLYKEGTWGPKSLDEWAVSQDAEGKDICGLAHGFFLQLEDMMDEEYHEASIRVDIEAVDHYSPSGFGDIWEDTAPNGEKYGFIKVFPEAGSGIYDGVVHGRTDGDGRLWIYAGLGDPEGTFNPDAPLDYGYELPGPGGGYNDVFDTLVQLKITIPRAHAPLRTVYVWAYFVRVQYQNMWEPAGGVYGNSFSGIGELEGYGTPTQSLEYKAITIEFPTAEKSPKGKASDYPLDTKSHTGQAVTTMDTTSSGQPYLDWAHWYQLRWDPYLGQWYWDDPNKLYALWFAEPNDPNDIIETMNTCEPYVLWADVNLPEPFDGNDAHSTVILKAVKDSNVVSKMPMSMYMYEKSPDGKVLSMFSDYVEIVDNSADQGYYYDQWNNLYAVIYVPQGGILEVDFPEIYGDFNADDKVDFYDFALFSNHYQDSVWDPNTNYDAMYEEPNNWDGEITMLEVGSFTENWLWQADGAMMGQDMGQSLSLTEGLYTAVAPAKQQPAEVTPLDIEELIKWLEELWLDEEVRKVINEDEWQKFVESVKESM